MQKRWAVTTGPTTRHPTTTSLGAQQTSPSLSAASTDGVGAVMTREEVIALLDRAMRERVDAARKRDEAEREAYADELCDDKDADS